MVAAGMAAGGFRGIGVALVMIMCGGIVLRIRLRRVLMSVALGGMAIGAGDHGHIGRHSLQRQGDQQYCGQ